MVDSGFMLADAGNVGRPETRFVPPKDWNGAYLDQWIFDYGRPGKANKFTLHCSLQAATKRMYIQAAEENNPTNVRVLGLQLDNYVTDPAALKAGGWAAGVVTNAAKMRALFSEYITGPLAAYAEEEQQHHHNQQNDAAGAAGAVGGGAAAAAAAGQQGGAWAWLLGGGGDVEQQAAAAARRRRLALALGAVAVAAVAVVAARRWRPRGA